MAAAMPPFSDMTTENIRIEVENLKLLLSSKSTVENIERQTQAVAERRGEINAKCEELSETQERMREALLQVSDKRLKQVSKLSVLSALRQLAWHRLDIAYQLVSERVRQAHEGDEHEIEQSLLLCGVAKGLLRNSERWAEADEGAIAEDMKRLEQFESILEEDEGPYEGDPELIAQLTEQFEKLDAEYREAAQNLKEQAQQK
eukprot:TRINITY_DN2724_c0_g1_i1.p2 TRINITY_DN2724_c0_g1~~TRINITY_DN2724_c0_g1_i1.p2  ORF type:complete len:203 (-),score=84.68 TRINITY_DN2724_c0_g1_i1:117-725(-)